MEGGQFFFSVVKEGDQLYFATDDENERTMWVQAIYRATGQSHKPSPPVAVKPALNTQEKRTKVGSCSMLAFLWL